MRPLKLKMNAFGPYPSHEEIDFTKLDNIYLVSGPTGAGKTTIFDAICFALYGETSGKTREQRDLKSDFAPEDEVTYVDLEFSLHGEVYRIVREPQQIMKGRKTPRAHSVELHMPGDKILTKIADVKEKIEEILGLNVEQFRQIVMLPQGEFRKLIESSTEEKEKIFRRIFSSKVYKDFQDRLKDKAMAIKKTLEKSIESRGALIKKINPGDNEKLNNLINAENHNIIEIINSCEALIQLDKMQLSHMEKSLNTINSSIESINASIEKGKDKNTKIQEVNKLRERNIGLKSQEEEVLLKEKNIDLGKKALEVNRCEVEYNMVCKSYLAKEDEVNKGKIELENNLKEAECAGEEVKKVEGIKSEREEKKKQLHVLEEGLKEFTKYQNISEECLAKKATLSKIEDDIKKGEENLNKINKEIQDINIFLEGSSNIESSILTFQQELKFLNECIEDTRDLYRYTLSLKNEIKSHKDLAKEYEDKFKVYENNREHYNRESEILKRQQAGILAKDLSDGDMCPVCGSKDHPNKAKLSDSALSEEEINTLLDNLEKEKEVIDEVMGRLLTLNANINKGESDVIIPSIKKILGDYTYTREEIDDLIRVLSSKGSLLKEEIVSKENILNSLLKERDNLTKKAELKKKLESSMEEGMTLLKNLEKTRLNIYGEVEGLVSIIKRFEENNNVSQFLSGEISKNIDLMKKDILGMDRRINSILERDKLAGVNLSSSKKNLENKQLELERTISDKDSRKREYTKALEDNFKNLEEYKSHLISKDHIIALEGEVKSYREEVLITATKIESLEKLLENYDLVDIELLENKRNVMISDRENVNGLIKLTFSRLQSNESIISTIKDITLKMEDVEREYSVISELSSTANGFNQKRITFERYVLLYHFKEILEAANIRFKIMTNDRYFLQHKSAIGDRRSSQGLDFDVYDNYTGKVRSIGSLSGGESFKASLALALGLSDVIQSYAGGVRIDTMFIDEGFGTLDSESLEKAIETLLELGSNGRVVGIISHVAELKERIPSKIEVTRDRQGSYIEEITS